MGCTILAVEECVRVPKPIIEAARSLGIDVESVIREALLRAIASAEASEKPRYPILPKPRTRITFY